MQNIYLIGSVDVNIRELVREWRSFRIVVICQEWNFIAEKMLARRYFAHDDFRKVIRYERAFELVLVMKRFSWHGNEESKACEERWGNACDFQLQSVMIYVRNCVQRVTV